MTETKFCKLCGVDRPLTDFHKDSQSKDGKHRYCKRHQSSYTGKGSPWGKWRAIGKTDKVVW